MISNGHTPKQHLDKEALRLGFLAGARRVIASRKELDRINVFPVPDKDTGANLAATMSAVIRRLAHPHTSVHSVGNSITDGALSGAQGNAGVIVAQFLQGLSEGLSDVVHVSMERFVGALRHAATSARKALAQPKEGTILTVISDVANHLTERVHNLHDFRSLIEEGVREARASLARTPEKLEALRRAGVVDAGALGFVRFLEGIRDYWVDGRGGGGSDEVEESPAGEDLDAGSMPAAPGARVDFRYCTEATVRAKNIDRDAVIGELARLGNSVVVAGSDTEIHAHVHTNMPAYALEMLETFGEVEHTKVDDMLETLDRGASSEQRTGLVLVVDSGCDMPSDAFVERHIHVVPVRITFGDELLRDRVDITPRQFYERMMRSPVFPTTSQPTPADFLATYRNLATTYEGILSVHLSSGLSGTYQSALLAAQTVTEETGVPISVIDSRSASVAQGLVAWSVARAINAGCDHATCEAVGRAASDATRVFVFVPTIEGFVRGGRLSPLKGRISNLLRLRPILTSAEGKLVVAEKALGVGKAKRRTIARSLNEATGMESPMFSLGHSAAPELAEAVERDLRRRFPASEIMISDTSPAIGAHAGPGGLAIGVLDVVIIDRMIDEAT